MPYPPQTTKPNLRNRSGQQSAPSTRSTPSASMASIEEYMIPAKSIAEEAFKKVDTDKKLDMMAAAMNKLSDVFNTKLTKLDTLEKKIDAKLEPCF